MLRTRVRVQQPTNSAIQVVRGGKPVLVGLSNAHRPVARSRHGFWHEHVLPRAPVLDLCGPINRRLPAPHSIAFNHSIA